VKTVIWYFTGTGNSLAAARKICGALGDCRLVPIAGLQDTPGKIVPDAERVGIVCPVYFTGLPAMVAAFASRLDLSRARYAFAVLTLGGAGGSPAIRQLDGILRDKAGRGLDAGFLVKMPGNYILMYAPPSGRKQEKLLAMADEEIAGIAEAVGRCGGRKLPSSLLAGIAHHFMYPGFAARVPTEDRKFSVTDACTSCGTCAKVCPAGNIRIEGGRPAWQHRCELCCACIHLCPVQAIQAGPKTAGRGRYRNPGVSIADLETRGGDGDRG